MKRLALALALWGLLAQQAQAEVQMRYLMGTLWTIEAEGPRSHEALSAAFEELHRLDALLSTYRPTSEISTLNALGDRQVVPLSPETAELLHRALGYARESGGAFDPSVGPLVALWGFKHHDYRFPARAALAAALKQVGHGSVSVAGHSARFLKPGMAVDLGAIGKGYAVDRALDVLRGAGMARARVDAGGNQGVYGEGPWYFGIKHPRLPGEVLGVVALSAGAVATSGDAEQGFWKDGVRYGHVIDPRTGMPVAGLWSVTVTAPTAEAADALATALYVLGPDEGARLLAAHPGCGAIFVAPGPKAGSVATRRMGAVEFSTKAPSD